MKLDTRGSVMLKKRRKKRRYQPGSCMHEQQGSSNICHWPPYWPVWKFATRCSTEHNGGCHIGSYMGAAMLANCLGMGPASCALVPYRSVLSPVCCNDDDNDKDNSATTLISRALTHYTVRETKRMLCPDTFSDTHLPMKNKCTLTQRKGRAPPSRHHVIPSHDNIPPIK